jgi:hypothetical protein
MMGDGWAGGRNVEKARGKRSPRTLVSLPRLEPAVTGYRRLAPNLQNLAG